MIRYYLFVITHLKINRILIELKLELFLLIFIVQYASKMSIVLPWNGMWMHFMPLLVQNYRVLNDKFLFKKMALRMIQS